jgi:hypothetical protein
MLGVIVYTRVAGDERAPARSVGLRAPQLSKIWGLGEPCPQPPSKPTLKPEPSRMIRRTKLLLACLAAAAALSLFGGCAAPWSKDPSSDWHASDMFDLKKPWPFNDDEGPKKGVPVRMASTWTDTILREGGKTPQRGFGGRVMFYGKENNEPILVDGQFVVYAFDETNREPTDNKPTRRYVFPADQVAIRMSKSDIGASYSFWLPWDEVGGSQTNISLICRFEPKKKGAIVVGEQTQHLLPGTLRPTTMTATNTPPKLPEGTPMRPAIRQMSYTTPAPASGNPGFTPMPANQAQAAVYQSDPSTPAMPAGTESLDQAHRMTTTSITLPESFQRRTILDAAQSNAASTSAADHMQSMAPLTPARSRSASAPAMQQAAVPQQAIATQPLAPPANRYAQAGTSIPTAFQAFSPANMPTMQPPNNNFSPTMSGPQQFQMPAQLPPTSGVNPGTLPREVQNAGAQLPATQTSTMPSGVSTTVSYLPAGAPSRPGMIPLPSFGSTPATPQAPATPAFQ